MSGIFKIYFYIVGSQVHSLSFEIFEDFFLCYGFTIHLIFYFRQILMMVINSLEFSDFVSTFVTLQIKNFDQISLNINFKKKILPVY